MFGRPFLAEVDFHRIFFRELHNFSFFIISGNFSEKGKLYVFDALYWVINLAGI